MKLKDLLTEHPDSGYYPIYIKLQSGNSTKMVLTAKNHHQAIIAMDKILKKLFPIMGTSNNYINSILDKFWKNRGKDYIQRFENLA